MHRLSRPTALASEDGQPQHNLSRSNSIIASQELRNSTLSPVTSQQTSADLIKGSEPVLLNEKSLLACLVRAVPAEATAKIRISSTVSDLGTLEFSTLNLFFYLEATLLRRIFVL